MFWLSSRGSDRERTDSDSSAFQIDRQNILRQAEGESDLESQHSTSPREGRTNEPGRNERVQVETSQVETSQGGKSTLDPTRLFGGGVAACGRRDSSRHTGCVGRSIEEAAGDDVRACVGVVRKKVFVPDAGLHNLDGCRRIDGSNIQMPQPEASPSRTRGQP